MVEHKAIGRLNSPIRRRWLLRAGVGALTVVGAAAPLTAAAQASLVADELRIISTGGLPGLDPVHPLVAAPLRMVGAAEGLLRMTPFGDVEGELARSFEMVDPLTWRIDLHPRATFWSGEPVSARAVVESLERSRQFAAAAATLLRGVALEPVGEWTVLFRSDAPVPGLPINLTNEWLVIHNARAYGPEPAPFDLAIADLTGFFRVAAWEPQQWVLLERDERYWGTSARMRRVRLDGVVDVDARGLAALSGEAHIVRLLPEAAASQVERSRSMRLVTIPSTGPNSVYLNVQVPPFDDVRVRQALAWAVDRDELVALALDGQARPTPSWLAPNPMFPEAMRVGYTRYDAAKAMQLLDEAGWRLPPRGAVQMKGERRLRFRLLWWGHTRPMAEVLQAQWARIGVEVEVEGSGDYGLVRSRITQSDWDALFDAWGTFGDPESTLSRHLGAEGDLNYGRLRDPVMEQLLAGFAGLLDAEERRQQALRANERAAEVVPFIPLAARDRLNAVSRSVRNYVPHFLNQQHEVHPDLWVSA